MANAESQIDISKATKPELRKALQSALADNKALTDTVGRLLRRPEQPVLRQPGREGDVITPAWANRHGISIPRADGIHESREAWVRVKDGTIVDAGLKNQSILVLMISLRLLDDGAEHHGSLYKDWRAAFLSRLDPTKSGEPGGGNPAAWSKEDRYSKLIHRIDKDLLAAMDGIVAARPKAKHLAAFQRNRATFAAAFLKVAEAMREINRQADDAAG